MNRPARFVVLVTVTSSLPCQSTCEKTRSFQKPVIVSNSEILVFRHPLFFFSSVRHPIPLRPPGLEKNLLDHTRLFLFGTYIHDSYRSLAFPRMCTSFSCRINPCYCSHNRSARTPVVHFLDIFHTARGVYLLYCLYSTLPAEPDLLCRNRKPLESHCNIQTQCA